MKRIALAAFLFVTLVLSAAEPAPTLRRNTVDEVIAAMTPEEKVLMVIGNKNNDRRRYIGEGSTWYCARLGLMPTVMCDGPAGVRMKPFRDGDSTKAYYSTAFPTATALAATWNTELVETVGDAMGNETLEYGADVLLAPAMNIQRDPLCGRNFEYYSEDPLLSGKMGAAMVRGIQSQGVGTSVKHFAANNQESNRKGVNAVISQRALREIYLRGFEIAIREAAPWTVMSSYNRLNGVYASQNRDLLTTVLRDEWGFDGMVMTDWFAGDDGVAQMKAGNDIIMGGFPHGHYKYHQPEILSALSDKTLDEEVLDRNIRRILGFVKKTPSYREYACSLKPDLARHAQVAQRAADEAMVLLKNDRQILPLQKTGKIAVIGPMGNTRGELFGTWVMLREEAPARSIFEAVKEVVGDRAEVVYAQGSNLTEEPMLLAQTGKNTTPTETLIEQALETAKDADVIVATVGEPSGWSGEARSRSDIGLPECQKALLKALHDTGKPVVVAIMSGRPLTLSWENERFDAILEAWHGGTMAGYALADVLFGDRVPSGKLTATFPQSVGQLPLYYNSLNTGRPYRADFWATTKYLDITNDPVYPFGYGLSYTTFDYSDIQLDRAVASGGSGTINATVKVTNTGTRTGDEIVQLYIGDPVASISRPVRELKNFRRITLKPGETQGVTFRITTVDLKFYNSELEHVWEPGEFNVCIGPNSRDVKTAKINWTK